MSYVCNIAIVLLLECYGLCGGQDGPIVETNYGLLRGAHEVDRLDRTYDVFLGIPFARPPLDDLRWKPSQPPEPWDGIMDVLKYSKHCIQPLTFNGNDSEDCLYLNIYVPVDLDYALANPLPIMVFFYGGAFLIGKADGFLAQELANTGDIIVVSVNYRVSSMGFYTTGDSVIPGNYGLWDAKVALEWINENGQYFGGDTSRITIFGQSAGASLVVFCMLSPHANQLFHRAIPISGGGSYTKFALRYTQFAADLYECNTTDSQEIYDCLIQVDGKAFDGLTHLYSLTELGSVPQYRPVIDGDFVPKDTREMWKDGVAKHIDLMTGATYHDSAGFVIDNLNGSPRPNATNGGNRNTTELIAYMNSTYGKYENHEEIIQAFIDRFPDIENDDPAIASETLSRSETDFDFASPTFYNAEKHVQSNGTGSTYYYEFRHRQQFQTGYPDWVNGSHSDDLYSVFGQTYTENEFSEEDLALSRIIMSYFSNFAHTGNPNLGPHTVPVFWPEYDLTTRAYLLETPTPVILNHDQSKLDDFHWCLYDFWGMMRPEWAEP